MLTYLINLDRSPQRLEKAREVLASWHVDFTRLSAVDGRQLPPERLGNHQQPFSARRYFLKDMTPGEIGCFLSHKKCWEALLQSDNDWAFICEDDIIFLSDPTPFISDPQWIPSGVSLIQLAKPSPDPEVFSREKMGLAVPNQPSSRLVVLRKNIRGGTLGYLIHKKAAQAALSIATPIPAPVDDFLFSFASPLRKRITPWTLTPSIISTDDGGQTDVGTSKGKVKTPFWRSPLKYLDRKWITLQNTVYASFNCIKDQR